ncbi:MAG: peptidoglycan DD-metalloendopeptidase family protein [Gammaproteobacteria bacterium]|nr:peptidoglycan DD-metalloendopeptidase family protein [Gammaproteobacteria bacterium]
MLPVRRPSLRILCPLWLIPFALGCAAPVSAPVQTRDRGQPAEAGYAAGETPAAPQRVPDRHIVQQGDTLYSIAWRYGADYRDVARWNGIRDPFLIIPGQALRLSPPAERVVSAPRPSVEPKARTPATTPEREPEPESRVNVPVTPADPRSMIIRWRWPTKGRVIRSDTPTARNGIDISGHRGQSIAAAAAGSVVYSGSGLLGYGRLIIVKHSDTYLSAYAHNDTLLVKEGDRVSSGQTIATMGIGSDGTPVLHFEIRKDGKPVNPLGRLPRAPF